MDRPDRESDAADPPESEEAGREQTDTQASDESTSGSVWGTLLGGVVALAVLGGGVYLGFWFNWTEGTVQTGEQEPEAARPVEVVTVTRGDQPVVVRSMGTVIPARQVTVRPQVGGRIIDQDDAFVPGGQFSAGQFMIQIEKDDYEQALKQAKSDLTEAEAALKIELGDQAVAREELKLLESEISDINRELILRKPQVSQARAAVRSARAGVVDAKLDVARTRITAPYDGQIVERMASLENNVRAGDAVAEFVGSDRYWIEMTVPVGQLRWIEVPQAGGGVGSKARISRSQAWVEGVFREGRVTQLIARLEDESRLAQIIVTVPDPLALSDEHEGKPVLLLDEFVDVRITGRQLEDVAVIDRDYVRQRDRVWVMNDEDRLETREVSIVFRGRDLAYIDEGLSDGDRVVKTNLTTPVDGMLLREVEAEGDTNDENADSEDDR